MATVVPILIASTRSAGNGCAGRRAQDPAHAFDRGVGVGGEADNSFSEVSRAVRRWPITSVKVPPRSIQKLQALSKT